MLPAQNKEFIRFPNKAFTFSLTIFTKLRIHQTSRGREREKPLLQEKTFIISLPAGFQETVRQAPVSNEQIAPVLLTGELMGTSTDIRVLQTGNE